MDASAFWRNLEDMPGLCASALAWRRSLGEGFDLLNTAFFEPAGVASAVPCPCECGCTHEVVCDSEGLLLGVCRCEAWRCDDLRLTPGDVRLWRLSLTRLARALCRALELRPPIAELGLPNTLQAGAWSTAAFPVILTVPHSGVSLRAVIDHLAATLRQRFALLAPTGRCLDTTARQTLAGVNAAFFPLENITVLADNGSLRAADLPGRIFAAFSPPPEDRSAGEVARRAFAIVQALDSGKKRPSLVTIFRLYCAENIDAAEIARQLGTSRATVVRRLQWIREKTGMSPRELRRFSPHLDKVKDSLADPRAAHIRERRAIDEEDSD